MRSQPAQDWRPNGITSKASVSETLTWPIKYVIGEDDAKQRIAELQAERSRVEAELAALEEAPDPIALNPVTLNHYMQTETRPPKRWPITPGQTMTAVLWWPISEDSYTAS